MNELLNSKPAIWALIIILSGAGGATFTQLATTEDLKKLEDRVSTKIDAFSGNVYELLLENVNDSIIDLGSISNRTLEQEQTLNRLKMRKEKLLRIVTTEGVK